MAFVIAWSGNVASIPTGFTLCDGTGGVPDLRNKFIKGAYSDGTRPVGNTGGSNSYGHTHSAQSGGGSHTHSLASNYARHYHNISGSNTGQVYPGINWWHWVPAHTGAHTHTTASGDSAHTHTSDSTTMPLPKYYRLAFLTTSTPIVVPAGVIALWSGTIASIPSGWYVCDGTNSTPDLRDKFIKGTATQGSIGTTGGAKAHTHSQTTGSHTHTITATTIPAHGHTKTNDTEAYVELGTGANGHDPSYTTPTFIDAANHEHTAAYGGDHTHTLTALSDYADYPAFYNLAYIQKAA